MPTSIAILLLLFERTSTTKSFQRFRFTGDFRSLKRFEYAVFRTEKKIPLKFRPIQFPMVDVFFLVITQSKRFCFVPKQFTPFNLPEIYSSCSPIRLSNLSLNKLFNSKTAVFSRLKSRYLGDSPWVSRVRDHRAYMQTAVFPSEFIVFQRIARVNSLSAVFKRAGRLLTGFQRIDHTKDV